MRADFDERNNQMIVYDEEAKEWLDFVLGHMNERMGWYFPKAIEEWLFELVEQIGFVIQDNPRDTLYCFDNAYINGEWGKIEEQEWSKQEAKELYEEGELLFYDETSGYFVKSL